MMTMHQTFVGVDIAKSHLDVAWPAKPIERIDNTQSAITGLVAGLEGCFVVMEATSVCDRLLRRMLSEAGIPFHRANPRSARSFARATGRLAKPDRGRCNHAPRDGREARAEADRRALQGKA